MDAERVGQARGAGVGQGWAGSTAVKKPCDAGMRQLGHHPLGVGVPVMECARPDVAIAHGTEGSLPLSANCRSLGMRFLASWRGRLRGFFFCCVHSLLSRFISFWLQFHAKGGRSLPHAVEHTSSLPNLEVVAWHELIVPLSMCLENRTPCLKLENNKTPTKSPRIHR